MKEVDKLTRLEGLAEVEKPDAGDLAEVAELIKDNEALARFFFSKANSKQWAQLIREEMIDLAPESIRTRILIPYLTDQLSSDLEAFIELIACVSDKLDTWSVGKVLDVALTFDPSDAIRIGRIVEDKILDMGIFGVKTLPRYIVLISEALPDDGYVFELLGKLLRFKPDPDYESKYKARNGPNDELGFSSRLDPKPAVETSAYYELIEKAVSHISQSYPVEIAKILVPTLSEAIRLKFFDDDDNLKTGDDYSEVWCARLDQRTGLHHEPEEYLAQACCSACEQIYDMGSSDNIEKIDKLLRSQAWLIFSRIRQHLYAKYPGKAQIEWIQDFIRQPDRNYGERNHHYEFQRMLHSACEKYGTELFNEGEFEGYIEAILAGPNKQKFIDGCKRWNGEIPSDEDFAKRQAYFHRSQLRPFKPVLYGKYKEYYDQLVANTEGEITEDEYYPMPMRGGRVHLRSPVDKKDIESMPDEELFDYLQEWNSPDHIYSTKDEPVEITHAALSIALKNHFTNTISKERERMLWWLEKAESFTRPIYCGAIVGSLAELVEAKNHDYLNESFDFCEWVLSHGDPVAQHKWDEGREDADPEKRSWSSSRASVLSFAVKSISKETGLGKEWRNRILVIYDLLCTGDDILLEKKQERAERQNAHSLVSTAINRTRSRALESLFNYANWVRKAADEKVDVPEVIEIVDRRIKGGPELTDPERVLLAMNFGNLRWIDEKWAASLIPELFKQDDLWQVCFSAYLTHSGSYQADFKYLKDQYLHAFEKVGLGENEIDKDGDDKDCWIINKWMGYHLLIFYLSGKIERESESDLCLQLFYTATTGHRELWGDLFNQMGRNLADWGTDIDEKVVSRVKDFFDWRIEKEEPKELSEYLFWLDGACLDAEWRMEGLLQTLPFADDDDVHASIVVDKLHEHFLESHPDITVKCFYEVTKMANIKPYFYLSKESAIPILKVGLASRNPETKKNAEDARENLLKAGRFEYLHLENNNG